MHRILRIIVLVTLIGVTSALAAKEPVGVEPGVWTKVEAQLDAQGVSPRAKAGRDVPIEVTKLLPAPYSKADDAQFGRSIAVAGDTMVVGVVDDDQGAEAGAAYVFGRNQGGTDAWGLVTKLVASDGASGDDFGFAVDIGDETIVVGARSDGSSGSAYVFGRDVGGTDVWGQVTRLGVSDGAFSASFGCSLAISGDTLVVGAENDDDNGYASGSAYVFGRDVGGTDEWGQVTKLVASDGVVYDFFGRSVDISVDTVVIGVPNDDGNGSVRVFNRNQGGVDAWGQVAKLVASDGAETDYFGSSVGISIDTVVVGAYFDDDNGSNSGSAYVFGRNEGGTDAWGQITKLVASDGEEGDWFGRSVSLDGDMAVVGAMRGFGNASYTGSAYVFRRNHGGSDTWGQVTKLFASDGAWSEYFGFSVGINIDTVVVGAKFDDDNGSNSGSVYVFGRNEGGTDAWGEVTKVLAPSAVTARHDEFGYSVAVDRDTAVVGAIEDDGNGFDAGSVTVFGRDIGGSDAWGAVAKLVAPDGASEIFFGCSVGISGDTVVVGAYGDNDNGSRSGSAYVFGRNVGGTDTWGQVTKLVASDGATGASFGRSLAISGDTLVVGAPYDHDNGSSSGSGYVFGRDVGGTDAWGQVSKVVASDGEEFDIFGSSIAISGDIVVVGAYGDDDNGSSSGSAYVFGRNVGGTDAWGQVSKVVASDGASDDDFGKVIAISGDTLVVGAPYDDDNGSSSGSAYVFGRDVGGPGTWGQAAKLTASDGMRNDYFGISVGISEDTAIVGAYGDDDNGSSSGSAYVFGRSVGGTDAWGQVTKVVASDGEPGDCFGYSAGISGDIVILGAYKSDDFGLDSGSAYMWQRIVPNPTVLAVGTLPDTGDGELSSGEWATVGISDFLVVFSSPMFDPPGDSDPGDCTNAGNWLLVGSGPDGIVQTDSCDTGVTGDDVAMVSDTFVYTEAPRTVAFRANAGTALSEGSYGLFACRTLESTVGRALDGDGDGMGGDDFILPFSIDLTIPLNPGLSSSSHSTSIWAAVDIIDLSWSGAADGESGVAGYSVLMDTVSATEPDVVVDVVHSADPHSVAEGPLAEGDNWYYHLRACDVAGNCAAAEHLGPFWIDTTPPGAVTDLTSTSHVVGTPSSDVTIEVEWTAATDALSGVEGYAVGFSTSSGWPCDQVQDVTGTMATSEDLGDGSWYVHVCAVDDAGNWCDAVSAGPFVVEAAVPEVRAVGSEGGTVDGFLDAGESALASITQLMINFSEPISNPAGNDIQGDLTNPDHYRVLNLGPDGFVNTANCTSVLGGDDVDIPQGDIPFAWTGDQTVSILGLGYRGLSVGKYALMICELQDLVGNEMVGPWKYFFTVSATSFLLDPNFEDGALSEWETVSPGGSDILWADADPSTPASGVVTVDPMGSGMGEMFEITQCVDVSEGVPYGLAGIVTVESVEQGSPTLVALVYFYRNEGCNDVMEAVETIVAQGDTGGAWSPRFYLSARAPDEARSAQVGFVIGGGTADEFVLSLDEAAFFENLIFVDGLETGGTMLWSGMSP